MTNKVIELLIESLQIPPSAYEKAEKRYYDIGEWFKSPSAKSSVYEPHIYPQGSFRLGTVIRPLNEDEEYDLDLGCRLQYGIHKSTHTQKDLKELVGADLEEYRKTRGIKRSMEEMHRCWRLHYADELNFHLDAVPSIPEESQKKKIIKEAMVFDHAAPELAEAVASLAGAVPDDRSPYYNVLNPEWHISNSEGYARWFEARMKLAGTLMEKRAYAMDAAKIDDLPARTWGSPLQQAIQILKRHRDVMFEHNPEGKPISVIITTLAARAYSGEADVTTALEAILTKMGSYVKQQAPRIANPVNPSEDFADKWSDKKYQSLNLAANFNAWLIRARADFKNISEARDVTMVTEQAKRKFALNLDSDVVKAKLGIVAPAVISSPKSHVLDYTPNKPWLEENE